MPCSGIRRGTCCARISGEKPFFRSSGIYRHQGGGHINRYQVFVERALMLAKRGGRIGLVLPSGFATDHTAAPLRRRLADAFERGHDQRVRQSESDLPDSPQRSLHDLHLDVGRTDEPDRVPLRHRRSNHARNDSGRRRPSEQPIPSPSR